MKSILVLSLLSLATAHSTKESTPQESARQIERQIQMARCAPQINAQIASRKRAAQLQFGAAGSSLGGLEAGNLFLNDYNNGELGGCDEIPRMKNNTCVLSPEVTQGPYYHTAGHPIRQNIAEDQLGLLFLMDISVLDIHTCLPISNVLIDIWHANTTGHYAGHADPDPKLKWEGPAAEGLRRGLLTKFPRANEDETWLRGAFPTGEGGVAQFTSIFPGYYTGRATHVHAKIHTNWTVHANGTFTSDRLIHTGQLFVPDDLNESIDKLHPYSTNPIKSKWGRTRNWEDSLQIYSEAHKSGSGATFEIEKLGGVISQGLIGFVTIGVDTKSDFDRTSTQTNPGIVHSEL